MNRFALLLLLTAAVALMTAGCGKKTDPAGTGQPTGEETVPSGAENESTEDPRIMPELQSEDDIGIFCGTVKDAGMNTMVVANKEYPDGGAVLCVKVVQRLAEPECGEVQGE